MTKFHATITHVPGFENAPLIYVGQSRSRQSESDLMQAACRLDSTCLFPRSQNAVCQILRICTAPHRTLRTALPAYV